MPRVLGTLAVLLALGLAGCGGDEPAAVESAKKPAARPVAQASAGAQPAPERAEAVRQGEKISTELWANGRVRVRRGPDRSFEIVRLTTPDEHFWAVEKRNGWYRLEGKRSRWIYNSVVRLNEERPLDLNPAITTEEEKVEADESFVSQVKAKKPTVTASQSVDAGAKKAAPAADAVLHVQGSRYYHTNENCTAKEAPTARRLRLSEAKGKGLRECRVCSKT